MKYAVLSGNERFEIREGELKSNGCAVLQVTHVGVCGTDTSYWHEGERYRGVVIGHEYSGGVVAPGTNRALKPGDRVAGYTQNVFQEPCGHCEACLAAKGLNPNKITVTSVLRTKDDVKRLRRRNGNASENSAHCYGTTFDVSWKRFQKVEDEDGRPLQDVSSDTLKLVLSEVLRDLKKAEKCYIKYELRQGCFHITTRM